MDFYTGCKFPTGTCNIANAVHAMELQQRGVTISWYFEHGLWSQPEIFCQLCGAQGSLLSSTKLLEACWIACLMIKGLVSSRSNLGPGDLLTHKIGVCAIVSPILRLGFHSTKDASDSVSRPVPRRQIGPIYPKRHLLTVSARK